MITLTEEQITDAHTKAPQSTREWMASQQVSNLIPEIMRRHRAEEMAPSIAALVGYTLIGLFPVRELPLLLTRETSLPPEQILQIAQDIRREILAPVARDLAALQPQAEQNYAAALRETGSTPAQQPVSDTSVQQGPPLPPKPQFPQAPPAPPQ
jgi:hypothetical protein